MSQLNAMDVHVHVRPNGWYDLRSDSGYRFSLPGIPNVRRVALEGPGGPIEGLQYRLMAERNSRGYFLTVLELHDGVDPVALREAVLRGMMPEHASVIDRRSLPHGSVQAEEVVVEGVSSNQHTMTVHSFAQGGRLFQAAVVTATASGGPVDLRTFFASIEVRGDPDHL